jgi:hypothetical protein
MYRVLLKTLGPNEIKGIFIRTFNQVEESFAKELRSPEGLTPGSFKEPRTVDTIYSDLNYLRSQLIEMAGIKDLVRNSIHSLSRIVDSLQPMHSVNIESRIVLQKNLNSVE